MPVEIKQQKSEVDEMFNQHTKAGKKEEEPKETPKEPEQKVEETEKQEQQKVENKTDELIEQLKEENAALKTGKALGGKEEPPQRKQEDTPQESQKSEEKEESEAKKIEAFITDEEFEEMQTNPQKYNEIMLRVYKRARQDASEDVIRQIPSLVQAASNRQLTLQQSVTEFYQKNPDLRKHAQYVGYVANQVKAQNPEMSVPDILNEAEQRVRADLDLTKQAEKAEEERQENLPKNKQPAFAHRGSGNHKGGKTDSRNDFQKQADEMINSLR